MSLTIQFYTMIAMIGMGGFFGASLDTYHRFLKRSERNRWIVFVHDVLFWLMQGLLIFYILYLINYGEIRFYIFIALICGFSGYQALVKSYYISLLEFMIRLVVAFYEFCAKMFLVLVFRPLRWLIFLIISFLITLGKGLYSLTLGVLRIVWFLLKLILSPIYLMFKLIWNVLPKSLKKILNKYYNKIAGFSIKSKNTMIKVLNRWLKKN
ncbi:spore cortex biosynthesis protein YabQ [Bacillus sp. 2205SS5-2]|uniref:spore cortex biosynthesis protein YabQ n=1 Tax=Bacillus sp. 2205SS5-2 TaxID=3109031 RepID=UPI003005DC6D